MLLWIKWPERWPTCTNKNTVKGKVKPNSSETSNAGNSKNITRLINREETKSCALSIYSVVEGQIVKPVTLYQVCMSRQSVVLYKNKLRKIEMSGKRLGIVRSRSMEIRTIMSLMGFQDLWSRFHNTNVTIHQVISLNQTLLASQSVWIVTCSMEFKIWPLVALSWPLRVIISSSKLLAINMKTELLTWSIEKQAFPLSLPRVL